MRPQVAAHGFDRAPALSRAARQCPRRNPAPRVRTDIPWLTPDSDEELPDLDRRAQRAARNERPGVGSRRPAAEHQAHAAIPPERPRRLRLRACAAIHQPAARAAHDEGIVQAEAQFLLQLGRVHHEVVREEAQSEISQHVHADGGAYRERPAEIDRAEKAAESAAARPPQPYRPPRCRTLRRRCRSGKRCGPERTAGRIRWRRRRRRPTRTPRGPQRRSPRGTARLSRPARR